MVQRERLARQLPGASAGKGSDRRADADLLCCERNRGKGDPGIGGWRVVAGVVEDVVLEEEAVPPCLLCNARQLSEGMRVPALAAVRDLETIPHVHLLATFQSPPGWSRPAPRSLRAVER